MVGGGQRAAKAGARLEAGDGRRVVGGGRWGGGYIIGGNIPQDTLYYCRFGFIILYVEL